MEHGGLVVCRFGKAQGRVFAALRMTNLKYLLVVRRGRGLAFDFFETLVDFDGANFVGEASPAALGVGIFGGMTAGFIGFPVAY